MTTATPSEETNRRKDSSDVKEDVEAGEKLETALPTSRTSRDESRVSVAEAVATVLVAPEDSAQDDEPGVDEIGGVGRRQTSRGDTKFSSTATRNNPGQSPPTKQDEMDNLVSDIVAQMEETDTVLNSQVKGRGKNPSISFRDLRVDRSSNNDPGSSFLHDSNVQHQQTPGAVRVNSHANAEVAAAPAGNDDHDDLEAEHEESVSLQDSTSQATCAAARGSTATASSSNETGVISAAVVDEEELEAEFRQRMKSTMVEATEVRNIDPESGDADEEKRQQKQAAVPDEEQKSWRRITVVGGVAVVVIIVVIVILVTTLNSPNNNPDVSPTPAPVSDYEYLEQLFLPISGTNITVVGTPQYQALDWLANDDAAMLNIQTTSDLTLTQRYVMAIFFYSTGGPTSWVDDLRFLSIYSVCEWPNVNGTEEAARTDNEVDCNEEGEITKIRIERNNLTGTIPHEIGVLTTMDIFTIGGNLGIVGTIPSEMGSLTLLSFLQFAGNSLSGTIPETFERLKGLETVSFFRNNLVGTLPEKFLQETGYNLEIFDVGGNMLTGTIPDAFITQSRLRFVFMEDNTFEGELPLTLYSQPSMQILSLSNNQLNGSIGPQIGALADLRSLYLDGNAMHGTLPTQMAGLGDLEQLLLSGNQIEGSLPVQIGDMRKLKTVDISNNTFTGTLPAEMGGLAGLASLNLDFNPELSGSIPDSLTQLTALEQLLLKGTNITAGLNEAF
ncbi:MAG: hypothetical protein SGILL_007654, partial [Bacillariaceae sp.]